VREQRASLLSFDQSDDWELVQLERGFVRGGASTCQRVPWSRWAVNARSVADGMATFLFHAIRSLRAWLALLFGENRHFEQ